MAERPRSFPDLPILDELGDELHRAARRADQVRAHASAGRPQGRRRPRGSLAWIGRRPGLVATAVLLVLGLPAVLLQVDGGPDGGDAPTAGQSGATTAADSSDALVSGEGPEAAWNLVAVRAGCVALEVEGGSIARVGCDPVERGSAGSTAEDRSASQPEAAAAPALALAIANGRRDGYVLGMVPEAVSRVRVTVGASAPVTASLRQVEDRPGSGDGQGKVFVAAFDDRIARGSTVRVVAVGERGQVIARSTRVHRP